MINQIMKTISSFLILLVTTQFTIAQSRASKVDYICKVISIKNPDLVMSIGFVYNGKDFFSTTKKSVVTSKQMLKKHNL